MLDHCFACWIARDGCGKGFPCYVNTQLCMHQTRPVTTQYSEQLFSYEKDVMHVSETVALGCVFAQ